MVQIMESGVDMKDLMLRRSDLAIEAVDQFISETNGKNSGVIKEERKESELKITCIDILKGYEKKTGKNAGRYISIDTSKLGLETSDKLEQTRQVFSNELKKFLKHKKIKDDATCLVVGLGNEHITPDALGPMALDNIIVTRHLYEIATNELDGDYRKVSALAPGVMGLTGIETFDIIESVVKKTKPDFLIVVDALAARAVSRVNKMIQMTDTGISPGSGVGNKRRRIDEASLGVPVIAIGIPTVVDAVSVTHDTIDLLLKHIGKSLDVKAGARHSHSFLDDEESEDFELKLPNEEIRKEFLGKIGVLSEEEKRGLLAEVLTPSGYNLIVTPKTIDSEMEDLSRLVSNAVNVALHPKVEFSA